jgi:hypothetical protein
MRDYVGKANTPSPFVPAKAGTQGHGPWPLDSRLRGNERSSGSRAECLINDNDRHQGGEQ